MPNYRVRQGHSFGRKDRPEDRVFAGQTVELTPHEAEPLLGNVLDGPVSNGDAPHDFDVSQSTVADVLDAVAAGVISAEDALESERSGNGRVTLIRELEDLVNGPDDG